MYKRQSNIQQLSATVQSWQAQSIPDSQHLRFRNHQPNEGPVIGYSKSKQQNVIFHIYSFSLDESVASAKSSNTHLTAQPLA